MTRSVSSIRPLNSLSKNGTTLKGMDATVVGGGIGGLSTACYLAAAGAEVTVLEQDTRMGGVANLIETDGYRFDTGPSWYLMPDVFERFFGHFDRTPGDYYDLEQLDPQYRVFWKDGDRADVRPDRDHMRKLFESYEHGAGTALDRYLADAREAYERGMETFVYQDRPRLRDFMDTEVVKNARAVTLLKSMDDYVQNYVSHPKLRQLLEYTLVFLGGSPYNTPAIYSMMSHVDLNLGVFYPKGGMYQIVEALTELADELDVRLEPGVRVEGIQGRRGGFSITVPERRQPADIVVSNVNPSYTETELLPSEKGNGSDYWTDRTYAPSAYLLYLGVEGEVDPLAHHTIVLPTDWDAHFESIFDDPAWPTDPSYYVSVPSQTDRSVAPSGCHSVVVLVPIAPGLPDDDSLREQYKKRVLRDLADNVGVDLRNRIVVERDACVSEFADHFGAPGGTALGLAHTLRQTGPLRPGHRGPVEGLYYTGSYTTPGIGVPMCLISGEHTFSAVHQDANDATRTSGGWLPRLY